MFNTHRHRPTHDVGVRGIVSDTSETEDGTIDPIFVSVAQAAKALNISPWSCYQLLKDQRIRSAKHGTRRLVYVDSLREYADSLGRAS